LVQPTRGFVQTLFTCKIRGGTYTYDEAILSYMAIPPPRTEDESADLIARLDALTAQSDTSQFANIQEYQNDHLGYMGANYGRFMNQFEMFFCAMTDYSHNINYLDKKDWPINRGFQFIIVTRALKQLNSAYLLLNAGAYEDAITVLRSAYESFLRIVFVSCHPECPYNVYRANGQTGAKFNATNFVKDELKLGWTKYGITSAFAHSNMLQVMGDMIEVGIEKKPKLIALEYESSEDMIGLVTNLMSFLVTAFLDAFDQLFTVDISQYKGKDKLQPHIDKLHEYALISHESLRGHTVNEYWRQAAVDLEDIFELMKAMDVDPKLKWKDTWKSIRQN